MGSREDGKTFLNIGKSRSGKTSIVKVVERLNKRVIAFDPKDEWSQLGFKSFEFERRQEFLNSVKEMDDGKISFCGIGKKDFNFFSAVAFNFIRQKEGLLIAEELGAVTDVNRAGGYWGRLINQGLAYGMRLQATVQRGQEVDKSIINNATGINIFQHATEQDAKSMADRIGVDISEIPRVPMQFIVWTPVYGIIIKSGRVVYKGNTPHFSGIKKGTNKSVKLAMTVDGTFKGVDYL